jgi:nitroreductase
MPEYELLTLLEAARWAPSAFNSQPWRFIYARRDTEHWPRLLGLLTESNQLWAKNASALIILVSKTTMLRRGADKEVPSWSHSFDAGAAWCNLALQAARSGWAAHGMVGFDKERAAAELGVPDGYRVEAAIAIGKRGDKSLLPESLQAREVQSQRVPLMLRGDQVLRVMRNDCWHRKDRPSSHRARRRHRSRRRPLHPHGAREQAAG